MVLCSGIGDLMSKLYKPNGKKECERRRKQIANGQLKEENGLVVGQEDPARG
jgi:hypothetical protein